MSLFQKSVEKKYLGELDSTLIDQKYADFQEYFGNPERQENIRNSKEEQFSLMWLCLAKDNLINDLPLKIKNSSVLQEENITKQLYADYSSFRKAIYNNLIKNNPETDKLLLCRKTKKRQTTGNIRL